MTGRERKPAKVGMWMHDHHVSSADTSESNGLLQAFSLMRKNSEDNEAVTTAFQVTRKRETFVEGPPDANLSFGHVELNPL